MEKKLSLSNRKGAASNNTDDEELIVDMMGLIFDTTVWTVKGYLITI